MDIYQTTIRSHPRLPPLEDRSYGYIYQTTIQSHPRLPRLEDRCYEYISNYHAITSKIATTGGEILWIYIKLPYVHIQDCHHLRTHLMNIYKDGFVSNFITQENYFLWIVISIVITLLLIWNSSYSAWWVRAKTGRIGTNKCLSESTCLSADCCLTEQAL